jgi:hypothetical protein
MSWSGAGTTRWGMTTPQSADPFSHADFDSLITNLDGYMVKGQLGFAYATVHGDISANNDAFPTIASTAVTIPNGVRNVLIVARAICITNYNSTGVMGVYLQSQTTGGTTTLAQSYVRAKQRSSSSTLGQDIQDASYLNYLAVEVNPPSGARTYKIAVNVEGGGVNADGKVIQTDGAGVYNLPRRAWIGAYEI